MIDQDWWRGAVIYQIYPRSFFDSNGDGIGDLNGVAEKLNYIAALGVDAVWLSPFFTSPMKDFGYDISDYRDVDPVFGTLAEFDRLLERAHALGLKVMIDQVWSHSSDQHPWFRSSRARREGPHADWYVWADPQPDGTPPNNWLSVFGGSAWTWEPRRRQYYLHHFLTSQPQLNLRNPEAAEAMLDGAEFWLRRGVDGFRLDAVDFFMHDAALRDNPPRRPTDGRIPAKPFGLQAHDYDMLQLPEILEFLERIRGLTDRYPGTTTLAEVSSQDGAFERVAAYTAGSRRLHMAYTLRPLRGGFDLATLRRALAESSETGMGWICWSFSNHDVERAVSRWNPGRGRAAPDPAFARQLMALLLTLRGSVTIYQGEELGLTEADLALEELRDPFGITYWPEFRGRDGSRTPMPWSSTAPHGGFTAHPKPWLPVPSEHRAIAADAQEHDPESTLAACRRFIRWRKEHPALVRGHLAPIDLPAPLLGIERIWGGERIIAVFNLSEKPEQVPLPGLSPLAGHGFSCTVETSNVVLPPYGVFFGTPTAAAHTRRVLESVA